MKGAESFADWYVKWLLFAYVAKTTQPLVTYSTDCAQCDEVVNNVNDELKGLSKFQGQLFRTLVIQSRQLQANRVDVTIKWATDGFKLVGDDGNNIRSYDGGDGFYVLTVLWRSGGWLVNEIRTVK